MLRNGDRAPQFTAVNAQGAQVGLHDFAGKPLVMIFTRGAFCPTTMRFLTAYQDFYNRVKDMGMELVAISADSVAQNQATAAQLHIAFPLLADVDVAVAKQYGVYTAPKRDGGGEFAEPAVVIIDKDGEIAYWSISSGPKGLPDPGAIAPILIYMQAHDGKY